MALVPLQHASSSPPQHRTLLPRGRRASHGAVRRFDTRYGGLASVEPHAQAATAAGVHAIGGGTAVSMPSAAMSDGSCAAAARLTLTTTASQPAATRPQSLPWCCSVAKHSMVGLSKRGRSCSSRHGSRRARHCWRYGGEHAVGCHERWLTCRCSTRVHRHHSGAAFVQAASEPAMVLRTGQALGSEA